MDSLIYSIAGFGLGALCAAVPLFLRITSLEKRNAQLEQAPDALRQSFDSLASEALRKNNEMFLTLARENIEKTQNNQNNDFEKRQKAIAEMVDPIAKTLKDMEQRVDHLGRTGSTLEGQLKSFALEQQRLRQETGNLVKVLSNTNDRGKWGEMQLQRAFEAIGLIEGTHFHQQVHVSDENNRGLKPDFVVHMPGGVDIVIDVKTPIEPYWKAVEEDLTQAEQQSAFKDFSSKLRDHLKTVSSKSYWQQFDSPEFVVMFLPTESLFSMAVSFDKTLIEDAAKHNVILASPTTMMGLLRVVMYGWQQQIVAEEAKTIAALGTDLYKRLSTFTGHMEKLRKGLNSALDGYNKAVGSLQSSVLPGARKFNDLKIGTGGVDLHTPQQIEAAPRVIDASQDDAA
ncbi:MAG: DNA recombination protein RmuC [Pseudomonadota bacterium]|jgi:DNA recombination protein RmuC|nr:DNA recombination protein RmuC [Alphaproteobacteria bacterium]MCS5597119.1 DNA recombination protein RmuC [Alphaproteobacteria bacterium]MEC7575967.1 DNA recombination protein RmuC [Pseudomonadota bacterium]MED5422455.1 DNA recombination protein RmuC [Pseudomonadota bacterium]|tara:strand:- start:7553 stop:8749 length:1197 start_codon:yes stop_codon:yes gene_type:complete